MNRTARGGLGRFAVAMFAAVSLVVAPALAQDQPAAGAQTAPQAQQGAGAPVSPPLAPTETRHLNLFTGEPNFAKGKRWFPNIFAPYSPMKIPAPNLENTPRLQQLIQDGKLMLSLQDAISLALENDLNIGVQRFTPLGDAAKILGANGRFDPILSAGANIASENRSQLFAGRVFTSNDHTAAGNLGYAELFHTGTSLDVTWTASRLSTPRNDLFQGTDPAIISDLSVNLSQPLLNGFGTLPNTYLIVQAKNTESADQALFQQTIINETTATALAYWELVYARDFVTVERTTVGADQQLYDNTNKELQIGTAAPLDVIQANAQLQSDKAALVAAQATQLQDETTLLNLITKDPLAAPLAGVEIVPTTPITEPPVIENMPLEDAAHEAWRNSPQLRAEEMAIRNAAVQKKATRNALLPSLTLGAAYSSTGTAGNEYALVPTPPSNVTPTCPPYCSTRVSTSGLGTAQDQIFHNTAPTYSASLTLSMPIRNRTAQAASAEAILNYQLQQTSYQQLENTVFVRVHQDIIAMQQDRAAVAAQTEAVKSAQESYDDEVKKFQLGTSTSFTVVQKQELLTQAQGFLLRDRTNLAEGEWRFNQDMSRTLDANHILISGTQPHTPGAGMNVQYAGPALSAPGEDRAPAPQAAGTINGAQ